MTKNAVISLLFILFTVASFCQSSPEKVIILKNKNNKQFKFIKEGKKIKYWEKLAPNIKLKGRINRIEDSIFYVNGKPVEIENLTAIKSNTTGFVIAKTAGTITVAYGTLVTGAGILLLAMPGDDGCTTVIGSMLTVAGVTIVTIGSTPYIIGGRKFKLNKNWEIMIGEKVQKTILRRKYKNVN